MKPGDHHRPGVAAMPKEVSNHRGDFFRIVGFKAMARRMWTGMAVSTRRTRARGPTHDRRDTFPGGKLLDKPVD